MYAYRRLQRRFEVCLAVSTIHERERHQTRQTDWYHAMAGRNKNRMSLKLLHVDVLECKCIVAHARFWTPR